MIFNERMETMSRKERAELQLGRLLNIVRRVYARVPFYRAKFKAMKLTPEDIRGLDDLRRLPFTTKEDLRNHYPFGFFACDRDEVARLHGSSGTRGKPTLVGYTKKDLENWAEVCARAICMCGGRAGDLFHNAYGYGLFTGGLGMHAGAEAMGAVVVPVSGGLTRRQVTLLNDLRPHGLACTPSYGLNLAEEMVRMGYDPSKSSLRYGIFGAEPWSEAMRSTLEKTWNIQALDIYGLSEVMGPGVSSECAKAQNGLHIADDHFLAEVIDSLTGEPLPCGQEGELVITTLTKEAFPVIRYRTGDIASLHPEPCKCGRTTLRMSRIKGRIDDMLIIRGVNIFPSEVEAVLLQMPELAPHYQLVLTRKGALDQVELQVELADAQVASADMDKKIAYLLKQSLGISVNVRVHPPNAIPRSEGKAVRIVDQRSTP